MERTALERLAVIEAAVLRTEKKVDDHMESIADRVSRLERLAAWGGGAVAVGMLWLKSLIPGSHG